MQVGQNLQNGVNYKYLELYTNNFWKLPLFLIFIVKLYIYIYILWEINVSHPYGFAKIMPCICSAPCSYTFFLILKF